MAYNISTNSRDVNVALNQSLFPVLFKSIQDGDLEMVKSIMDSQPDSINDVSFGGKHHGPKAMLKIV